MGESTNSHPCQPSSALASVVSPLDAHPLDLDLLARPQPRHPNSFMMLCFDVHIVQAEM